MIIICILFAAVTEAGKVGDKLAQDFFRYEYILNHLIGESLVGWHHNMSIVQVLLTSHSSPFRMGSQWEE